MKHKQKIKIYIIYSVEETIVFKNHTTIASSFYVKGDEKNER